MKNFFVWAVLLTCAVYGAVLFLRSSAPDEPSILIHGRRIFVEQVRTPADQARGLGGRMSLARDHGMLFVFEPADRYAFWMKDMRFPLDIIWLNNGTVVDEVTLMAPKVGEQPALHQPAHNADRVLELNAGQAESLGLHVGTLLDIP